jgi:putative GTP pyrophosphokinase
MKYLLILLAVIAIFEYNRCERLLVEGSITDVDRMLLENRYSRALEVSMKKDIYILKKQFFELADQYEKLAKNLVEALKILLSEINVGYLTIEYRIKSFDSFLKKIERKKFESPFEQIEDICGIRIICYYRSDIEKICEIISKEFRVLESEDKEELLDENEFGYRSHHFIVKVKEEWLSTPNYRDFGNLKAEVQIRTNLMHTWAEIEHKLEYKKDDDIPMKFKRKFSRISAMLEEADEQFEELRAEISKYRQEMLSNVMEENFKSMENDQINMDTLQVFMDYFFQGQEKNTRLTSELVSELKQLELSIGDLKEYYDLCNEYLESVELDTLQHFDDNYKWYQVSSLRTMLELCSKEYREKFGIRKDMKDIIKKYRAIMKQADQDNKSMD